MIFNRKILYNFNIIFKYLHGKSLKNNTSIEYQRSSVIVKNRIYKNHLLTSIS